MVEEVDLQADDVLDPRTRAIMNHPAGKGIKSEEEVVNDI